MLELDIIITICCPICGRSHGVAVREEDYCGWQEGELAQDAFPYLSPTEREQLISHLCPICQEEIFG